MDDERGLSWPLELVNSAPLDIEATAAHIEELRGEGDPDLFAGFDRSPFPRATLPALALASAAYRELFLLTIPSVQYPFTDTVPDPRNM